MPQITVSIAQTNQLLSYNLPPETTLTTLKEFISAESGIEVTTQELWFNSQPLSNESLSVDAAGIGEDDLIVVQIRQRQQPSRPAASAPSSSLSPVDQQAEVLRQQALNNPQVRASLQAQVPQLARALNNAVEFRDVFRQANLARQEEDERIRNLDDNITEENQVEVEKMIRLQQIEQHRQEAMEEMPELFGRITMLYIKIEVNGHPVKAFVDSGAQATIISPGCAEACNIARLIDHRYAGIAKGVGTAKILGRIHKADVKVGDYSLPCAFTVMEGKDVDMLFGLDLLKRYQACIDLSKNQLTFPGGVSIPFLGESDIPKMYEEALNDEPTVPGPDGQSVGAVSGAIKPSASTATAAAAAASSSSSSENTASASTSASANNFGGQGRTLASSGVGAEASAQGQRQAQPPRPSAPTPSRAANVYPEEDITLLTTAMGVSREQAIEALRACGGNVEYASSLLFGG